MIALSYRGYWTSRGRPSEQGINIDAQAAIHYAMTHHSPDHLVLWGQSLGAGVACSAAASTPKSPRISGLLLETPFVSVHAMLLVLYPQKWLPYRYLGPFLRNHWDSRVALRKMAETKMPVLILQAGKDELVPAQQGEDLEKTCHELEIKVERKIISGALHNEVVARAAGRRGIVDFIKGFN